MRSVTKVAVVVIGYLCALAIALGVVAIYAWRTTGPDRQASAGMFAFGDSVLFLFVFAIAAIPATAAALGFLRKQPLFWNALMVVAVIAAVTSIGAGLTYAIPRAAGRAPWLDLAPLRIFAAPAFALLFLIAGIFAPSRSRRFVFVTATVVEVLAVIYVALIWTHPVAAAEACDVRELRFFNGFASLVPPGICVAKERGPDFDIYRFSTATGAVPFLAAYAGYAANFPYTARPEGETITEVSGGKLKCGPLVIHETRQGEITHVGGAVSVAGKRCGEMLVRATAAADGSISSEAVHFWYSDASAEQERVIEQIIGSVQKSEQLPATLNDSVYGVQRRIWIAQSPWSFEPTNGNYNLVVLLMGETYLTDIAAADAAKTLVEAGKILPTVTVMVDTSDLRPADIANRAKFAGFLADQLMPWLRTRLGSLPKASRVTIGGFSVGGVTAAYAAFRHPELFGNVLSQSGAFWRGNEGASDPTEWLTAQLRASPRLPIRFYVEVGGEETISTPSGVVFIEANRHLRDVLKARGYTFQYVEVPGGKHEPTHWRAAFPAGLTYLLAR